MSLEKLEEALQVFVGTHDFRSFSTGDARGDDTVRTINSITLTHVKKFNAYRIEIKGPKFLHHMNRRIVGASFDVASRNQLPVSYLREVLAQRNPSQNLTNAPAKGLMLYTVAFNKRSDRE